MGQMVYNVNDSATQVLAARQVKENIFVDLVHKNGYGVTQHEETNVSTLRIMKVMPFTDDARQLGEGTNGAWFNSGNVETPEVVEYDLNLLYLYDKPVDIPEVQQDMVSVNLMDNATKNIGGRVATEINASTTAVQLATVFNAADEANTWEGYASIIDSEDDSYAAVQKASTMLDDGDEANGIQAFPFAEREIIMRPSFRSSLLSAKGVLVGGSNYAQSMLAKGAVSPEARKEWGNMYCGEIDGIPCYISPAQIWKRAGEWAGSATAFNAVEAIVCAASATDRGISTQDYIKIIDSPNGAGKRLQPKTRWGINVPYAKGIVPILKNGTSVPSAPLTVKAVGSR
jgi:hypothetical protein